jgi:two-component system, sensor histidine kinase and response regulator
MEPFSAENKLIDESFITPLLSILIVEDNPGDVVIVRELLAESGAIFTLTNAATLRDSLSLCVNNEYDVILLDLGLPDSFGIETLKKIQVFKVIPPVIVMTGLDDEDVALASLREGAQDYLVKNRLTSENVLRAIKYGIERKKLQDLQKKNTHQFSILSTTAAALNECEEISLIYTTICNSISLLLENANIISLEFSNQLTFRVANIGWLESHLGTFRQLAGLDLQESVFQIADQNKEVAELLTDGKLHEINDGLYAILPGNTSGENYGKLEKAIGIKYMYVIGFLRNKNFFGEAVIFSQVKIGEDDIKIIETLCTQASLSIYRRSIEKDLRLSENRYRKLSEELELKVKDRTSDLESLNSRLNQELTERNLAEKALKKSELQLRELNATKDKFFNIIAHDLKNPFTSLLGASELLFENINQLEIEEIRSLAELLNESAKGGYAILQNLLDWSRSQTGLIVINPEEINLTNLIGENIANQHLYAKNKKILLDLEAGDDVYVFSDKNMLNTILRNLLSNALKFTFPEGEVHVKVTRDTNKITISVKDTGVGISESDIHELFRIDTKFQMPGTEKEQGTGLGLKLCREFVEKLGGKIWVESIINKGSEFKFSIPQKKR